MAWLSTATVAVPEGVGMCVSASDDVIVIAAAASQSLQVKLLRVVDHVSWLVLLTFA